MEQKQRSNNTYLYSGNVTRRISAFREAFPQILAVCIKNVMLMGFGMTLGFPTILIAGLTNTDENEMLINQDELSWISSINLICVPLGCVLSGPLSTKLGRRKAMQLANIPLAATWLLFKFCNATWQIYFGLGILGLLHGCIEAPVITYVAEITTPSLRGVLSATSTLSTILGILLEFLLGTFFYWRNVALMSFALPLLSSILLIFVPESPIWLISQNRFLDARISLAWLRGWLPIEDVDAEFSEINKQMNQTFFANLAIDDRTIQPKKKCNTLEHFLCRSFFLPFGVVAFVFFLRHFTGMTNVQTYAVEIFSIFDAPIDKYYATVILGSVEVLGCLLCLLLVHFTGKRILTCTTMLVSVVCLLGVAISSQFKLSMITPYFNWIPSGCLIAYAFSSHAGLRILPWILTGEVFTNETRAVASGLSAAFGYICGFLVNKLFYTFLNALGISGLFYCYAGLCIFGVVILYFILPETEGKSLVEICEYFSGNQVVNLNDRRQSQEEFYSINLNDIEGKGRSYKRFSDYDTNL